MRAAAFSLAGINLNTLTEYRADLTRLIESSRPELAVLPAYSALALGLGTGAFVPGPDFPATFYIFSADIQGWNDIFLELHGGLAREQRIYLAAGSTIELDKGRYYHTAYCFDPAGELCCRQRQTHLTRAERDYDFDRGEELFLFDLEGADGNIYKTGLVVGNDARHPEVGRIMACRGADLLLHSGALKAGPNCWRQAAGMWSQVQQNQFFAVEAQFCGNIAGEEFGAGSALIAPCEITPESSGYLARGYPETPVISARFAQGDRRQIKQKYPILELLNREAYAGLLHLYSDREKGEE